MAYCTQTDLLTEVSEKDLAELTSDADGVIDAAVVTQMIANADSEIDGYVGKKYKTPLSSPVPPIVKTWSIRISLYNLFARRSNRLGGISEVVEKNYKNAIKSLEDVAKGLLTLGVDPPPAAPSTGQPSVETNIGDNQDSRDFSKNKMSGF